jgi:hypothetical protein
LQALSKLTPEQQKQLVDYANLQALSKLSPEQQKQLVDYANLQALSKLTPEQQKQLVDYANLQALSKLSPAQQKQLVDYANLQTLSKLTPDQQKELADYKNLQTPSKLTPDQQKQLVDHANLQQLSKLTPDQQKQLVDYVNLQQFSQLTPDEYGELTYPTSWNIDLGSRAVPIGNRFVAFGTPGCDPLNPNNPPDCNSSGGMPCDPSTECCFGDSYPSNRNCPPPCDSRFECCPGDSSSANPNCPKPKMGSTSSTPPKGSPSRDFSGPSGTNSDIGATCYQTGACYVERVTNMAPDGTTIIPPCPGGILLAGDVQGDLSRTVVNGQWDCPTLVPAGWTPDWRGKDCVDLTCSSYTDPSGYRWEYHNGAWGVTNTVGVFGTDPEIITEPGDTTIQVVTLPEITISPLPLRTLMPSCWPSIIDLAGELAMATGLVGHENGPQDAYRHCLGACLGTQACGEAITFLVGVAREVRSSYFIKHPQTPGAAEMDLRNNQFGQLVANSPEGCERACMNLLESGMLVVLDPALWHN